MSTRIKVLDPHCVNQIAAGEVVERPLSVVKELIENSLDAGAKNIEVQIEGGGTPLIRVKDDGIGILPDDLHLAVLPHATSKISAIEDLNQLQTLGFRGEALPSIAAVSKLSIISRPVDRISGYEIRLEGGNFIEATATGSPYGTVVTVRDLFFNTPARHKFLRSKTTEFGLISEMVERLALARPDVSFTLRHPANLVLNTPGRGDLRETIAAILGSATARRLIPVSLQRGNLRLTGYLSPPDLIRSSKAGITFLVNGRVIRSQLLNQALKDGYHTLIPAGSNPLAVIALTMPPADYDVNIHPAKMDVKFSAEKELRESIAGIVRSTLLQASPLPHFHALAKSPNLAPPVQAGDRWEQLKILYQPAATADLAQKAGSKAAATERLSFGANQAEKTTGISPKNTLENTTPNITENTAGNSAIYPGENKTGKPAENTRENPVEDTRENEAPASAEAACGYAIANKPEPSPGPPAPAWPEQAESRQVAEPPAPAYADAPASKNALLFATLRPIGQVFTTYLLCTDEQSLYIIDQHAAHERIRYEELLGQLQREKISSQILLAPETVDLTIREEQVLLEYLAELREIGFIVEHFGNRTYFLRGIPVLNHLENPAKIFRMFLEEIMTGSLPPGKEKLLEEWVFMLACRTAIKGNEHLSLPEMAELIQRLGQTVNPFSCPHGRPTVIAMSKKELENRFYR